MEAKFVRYRDFGAVGDGAADDFAAVCAAHDYANAHDLPVAVHEGTYRLGAPDRTRSARIETDVDWTGASFLIDDSEVTVDNRSTQCFAVESRKQSIDLLAAGVTTLSQGQAKLDFAPGVDCYVRVIDKNTRHFIREGLNRNSGLPATDCFILHADGTVDPTTPIIWDFPSITSITAMPLEERTLTIRGGTFTHIANQAESKYTYYTTGLIVHRSNTVIDSMTHYVQGEGDHGAPYDGMIQVYYTANVTVQNCLLTAHKIYNTIGAAGKPVDMGTYDIRCNSAINVRFLHDRQTTDIMDRRYWGIFVSDYCKNLELDDCVFSRFDAHMGVTNVTIRHSTLGWQCCNLIGHGLARIEDSTLYGRSFADLRGDYGSTWHGDLSVKNCTWLPAFEPNRIPKFLGGFFHGGHNFGYECYMPQHIEIDGLTVEDGMAADREDYHGVAIFANITPDNKNEDFRYTYPYHITKTLSVKNFRAASGKTWRLSDNPFMYRDVAVTSDADAT